MMLFARSKREAVNTEGMAFPLMSWRDLIPKTTISQETMEALGPVFMGQKLFSRGQYLEAEAMYCQALENFPPKSGGRVLIYNKLGILYEKMGNSRRALDSYEKGVKEGALTPFTYHRMCCLHLEAGRLPQALDCAQQGIKILKKARTNVPQEIYFWFIFQRLKRKITRRMPPSQRKMHGF
jgi:tetratricopeptide (TPR) repeat protein